MSCRLCRVDAVVELIDFGRQPIVHHLLKTKSEKQNLYVPGCNLKITPWHETYSKKYTMLLGVNTENEYKVIEKRKLHMSNVFSTTPPSTNLPMFWKNIIYD
jgi:hypothetical protein